MMSAAARRRRRAGRGGQAAAGYIGALDQGTTSTRFLVIDRGARVIAGHQVAHRQLTPRPAGSSTIRRRSGVRVQEAIRGALDRARLQPRDLEAVGITNQRETTVLWDRRTGVPVHHAIVWQDTRTDGICRELARAGGPDRLRDRVGLPLATYFSGPKVRWLLEAVPGARERAEAGEVVFGTVDSWLIWNLTGGPDGGLHLTDVSNASRTLLIGPRHPG
ncbi:protein containing Carbohydrate kinase, FGGY, partial [mine drainage metagenome]